MGGRGIVAHHEIGVFLRAIVAVDDHVADLAVGRQRVVIDDDRIVIAATGIAQHAVALVVNVMAQTVLLHAHSHAVIEGHAVVPGVGVGLLRGGCHAEAQQQG